LKNFQCERITEILQKDTYSVQRLSPVHSYHLDDNYTAEASRCIWHLFRLYILIN